MNELDRIIKAQRIKAFIIDLVFLIFWIVLIHIAVPHLSTYLQQFVDLIW